MKSTVSLLAIIFILGACRVSQSSFSDAKKWVPADFDINRGTLLIQRFPGKESWNTAMESFLSANYPGKYVVMAGGVESENEKKYGDLDKYPFIFKWKMGFSISSSTGMARKDPDGHFYDRRTGKDYPTTKKYNNYGNQSYKPFLNSIVKVSKMRMDDSVPRK